LSVFFTTFSFCVIFIVKVYTVLIKVYTVFFGKKWVALEKSRLLGGCKKRPVIVIYLDLHYKHEAASKKISKSDNFGCIVATGNFIK